MNFFNTILEEIPQSILVAEVETGRIVYANKSAEKLLGLPKEKIIGLHQSELHPQQSKVDYKEIFKEDSSTKTNFPVKRKTHKGENLFVKHSSGRLIAIEIFSEVFILENKKYIIGLFIENTKRIKTERQNKLLQDILVKVEEVFRQGSFQYFKKPKKNYFLLSNGAKNILNLSKNLIVDKELVNLVIDEQKDIFKSYIKFNEPKKNSEIKNFIFFINNKYKLIQFKIFINNEKECYGIIKDITEEYQGQEKLKTKELHLRMLSECHKVLFYAQEELSLLNQICKVIVESGGYLMSWIGYKRYDQEKNIDIISYYCKNLDLENYVKNLKLNWRDDNPFGLGPAGVACREGRIDIEKDLYFSERFKPIHHLVVKYGLQSLAAIPIFYNNRVIAILVVYSDLPDAFKEEEIDILQELAINLGIGINLLRERKSKLKLLEQNILLTKVLDNTNVAIIIVGKDGKILYLNRKFEDISGYLLDEIIGKNINILKSGLHDQEFYQDIWETLLNKKDWKGEIINKRKDGSLFLSRVFISPVLNDQGDISHFIQILEDITLEKFYEEQLEKIKFYDSVTHLPNRNYFIEKLNQFIRIGENFYLLLLDIDNFSKIVQDIGFENSDILLAEFSNSIKEFIEAEIPEKIITQEVFLSRIGNDEFGLLLCSFNSDFIIDFSKKIIEKLKKTYKLGSTEYIVSFSIGISIYPDNAKTADDLLRFAEIALKRSKEEKGSASFGFLTKDIEKDITEKAKIENQLQISIYYLQSEEKSKELQSGFYLEYQPVYNLFTNQIVSLEALIRWNAPKLGIIPPSQFIPIAEKNKLIIPLGEYIIKKVCSQIIIWQEENIPIVPIAINISYVQLKQKSFIYFLHKIFKEYRIDPSFLEFEITENTILQEEENTKAVLEELKNLKIKLLIDDFGIGYSSLSYLLKYQFDVIKIDQLFVKKLIENNFKENNALKLIRSIVQIAKNLELKIIAEGIEKQEQKFLLLKEGCEYGQGFYLSLPRKPEEIKELLLMNKKT